MDNSVSLVGCFCRYIYSCHDSCRSMVQGGGTGYSHGRIWSVLGGGSIYRSNGWGCKYGPVESIRTATDTGDRRRSFFRDQPFHPVLRPAKNLKSLMCKFIGLLFSFYLDRMNEVA